MNPKLHSFEASIHPQITTDTLSYSFIAGLQQRFTEKIFNPLDSADASDKLRQVRDSWNDGNTVTVFTSGVFDMLHPDHAGYLLHTKAVGAATLYGRQESPSAWHELPSSDREAYTLHALGSGMLRLVVSIDGDRSVAVRKGFNPDKGGSTRPIYAWNTRALQVASQTYLDPLDNTGQRILPIVDAVTIHGPDDFNQDSAHASHFELVEALQPDVWAVFAESTDILEEAPRRTRLGAVALHTIMDGSGTHYFEDDVIGKMSTTKIVQRIKGEL